jgi:hypothetical protein
MKLKQWAIVCGISFFSIMNFVEEAYCQNERAQYNPDTIYFEHNTDRSTGLPKANETPYIPELGAFGEQVDTTTWNDFKKSIKQCRNCTINELVKGLNNINFNTHSGIEMIINPQPIEERENIEKVIINNTEYYLVSKEGNTLMYFTPGKGYCFTDSVQALDSAHYIIPDQKNTTYSIVYLYDQYPVICGYTKGDTYLRYISFNTKVSSLSAFPENWTNMIKIISLDPKKPLYIKTEESGITFF